MVSDGATNTAVGFDWLFAIKIATIGSFCNQNCHHALKFAISIRNQIAIRLRQNILQLQLQLRVHDCDCENDCNLIAIIFAIAIMHT